MQILGGHPVIYTLNIALRILILWATDSIKLTYEL